MRRWRIAAILVASLVPGAIDASHTLASGGRVEPAYLAFTTLGVIVLLAALTATFDLAMRRRMTSVRGFALSAAVAVGLGVAESLAGGALAGAASCSCDSTRSGPSRPPSA